MINVRNYLWLKTVNIWQSKSNLIECNYERGNKMEVYDVNVRVELFDIVKAHNEDEAVKIVEEKLLKDQSLLMDNLVYEVNEAWKIQ